jgi:hypothetical protein
MAKKTKKTYRPPLPRILKFAAMLKREKLFEDFVSKAGPAKVGLIMDGKTAAFLKNYLTDNKLHAKAAKALGIKPKPAKAAGAKAKAMAPAAVQQDDPCPCVAT